MVLWSTLIYAPIAHWVWNPSGLLRGLGAIDFAGGIVVHISAGLSALAAALVVGRRKGYESHGRDIHGSHSKSFNCTMLNQPTSHMYC